MPVDCSDFRDSFCLCLLNSGTSFLSGFAIFSVLGYMSQKQGVDINSVAESGMNVIWFEMTCWSCLLVSCLIKHSLSANYTNLFVIVLRANYCLFLDWGALIEPVLLSPFRTRPCVHSLPSSCHSSTVATALVCVLLYYDHPARNWWTSKFALIIMFFSSSACNQLFKKNFLTSVPLQFIGLESMVTSLSDIFPSQIRKGYRRELLLLLICSFCYVVDLLLVSQVNSASAFTSLLLKDGDDSRSCCLPLNTKQITSFPLHFSVFEIGWYIYHANIWPLCVQRTFPTSNGTLPVDDNWMDLRWDTVPLSIVCQTRQTPMR